MIQLESIEQIQTRIYSILCFFADICDQYGLTYSLCGGTLLGAVRHKGFIPWDNDVDVFMPRPDYNKLVQLFLEKEIPYESYRLLCASNGSSTYPFAKIVDLQTHVEGKYTTSDQHLWIDIFPVDGMPQDIRNCNKILKKAKRIKMQHKWSTAIIGKGATPIRALIKMPALLFAKIQGTEYFERRLDALARQYDYNTSENAAAVVWSCGVGELIHRGAFKNRVKVSFCGREFWAISEWDRYLSGMYGDYMQLPPENKRETHSLIKATVIE